MLLWFDQSTSIISVFCVERSQSMCKCTAQAHNNIREKAFREMKKDVGMTTAQKSKETRRIEMGSIFVLYIQPTIPTYMSGSFRL